MIRMCPNLSFSRSPTWLAFGKSSLRTQQPWTDKFVQIHEASNNDKKASLLFHHFVRHTYAELFPNENANISLPDAWSRIQRLAPTVANKGLDPLQETMATWETMTAASRVLAQMVNVSLLQEGKVLDTYKPGDLLDNLSDFRWYNEQNMLSLPFTQRNEQVRDELDEIRSVIEQNPFPESSPQNDSKQQTYALLHGEREAAAGTLLTTPFIDENCLFHEIGCWNGTTSINNLVFAHARRGVFPKQYLGTDLNHFALAT